MPTHMWNYGGSLEETRATLSLEADEPSFRNRGDCATGREAIRVV